MSRHVSLGIVQLSKYNQKIKTHGPICITGIDLKGAQRFRGNFAEAAGEGEGLRPYEAVFYELK